MSNKTIGPTGLAYLWSKIKSIFVSALGTSGNYLTWTKNGTTNNITIPYSETSLKLVPIATKTYTNVTAPANNDPNGFLYYAHMIPTSANQLAYVKFRVIGTMAGVSNLAGDMISIVEYCTYRSTMLWYQIHNGINNTSYRNWYNHCVYRATTTGITNNYGHLLGFRFYSSYNPTSATYARTITIEILETQNCTITFEDSMILYANAPGTGSTNYDGRTEYDGTSLGDKHTGDNDLANYQNREYYSARTTSSALYRYMMCLTKLDGSLVPINNVSNNITTNKTLTTDSFDPFGEIFYWGTTTTISANANVSDGSLYRQILFDLRYSFNTGGYDAVGTLTERQPLYLVAELQSDGSAKLHSSPLSLSLPSTEDGLIYIYLGRVHPDTYPYRLNLSPKHPVYWYSGGGVKIYSDVYSVILENEEVISAALNDINSRIENIVVEETDPTVPDWAKSPYPPTPYDIGALDAYSYVDGVGFNNGTSINHYTACYTSASTTAKTASKANFQLSTGSEIIVKFTYTNTASNPTLNINSTGARSIYYNGTNIPANALAANRVYKFVYDGSYWQLVGTLGYTKTSELTNDAGFLTNNDVVDEVNLEDKLVTSNAVYEYITEDEKVIASALNDLNERIGDNEVVTAAALTDLNSKKLNKLVSGTNIKTINNQSLLGEGNITISGGGSGGDVNVIETVKVNGTALTPDSNKAVNISAVTSFNGSTGAITYSAPVTSVNGNTGAVVLNIPAAVTESTVSGWGFTKNAGTITGVTGSNGLTGSGTSGSVTISHAAPSTSPAKTTSAVYPITIDLYGHITAAGTAVTIPTQVTESTVSGWGFTKNAGTITGINMNGASKGTSGVVDLGTVITAHQDISGKADKSTTTTAGTYKSVTVNSSGIVTGGSNPTTLAGYGITDAYTKTESDKNYWTLQGGTNLNPSSTNTVNLNTITEYGNYYCMYGTSYTNYVTNKPDDSISLAFTLKVYNPAGSRENYIAQCFQFYSQAELYTRYSTNGGSTWNSWRAVQRDFTNLTQLKNIYTGSSAPSSSTGSNGDIYIQTS